MFQHEDARPGLQPRVLRKALELVGSEPRLAECLGISRPDLSMFLAGTEFPTESVFLAACDILRKHGATAFLKALTLQSRQQR